MTTELLRIQIHHFGDGVLTMLRLGEKPSCDIKEGLEGVACFKDIGIGDIDNLGENIHEGILYLPTYYSGEIEPAGNPIIVSCNGV